MKTQDEYKQNLNYGLTLALFAFGILSIIFLIIISSIAERTEKIIPVALEATPCAANYNKDSVIDNLDLVLFIQNFRQDGINCRYDLTGDCYVDTMDYSLFAKQFGDQCTPG